MKSLVRWLESPPRFVWIWLYILGATWIVLMLWIFVPPLWGDTIEWRFYAFDITLKNLVFFSTGSIGEEVLFRIIPCYVAYAVFPKRGTLSALAIGSMMSIAFGVMHLTTHGSQVALALSGIMFTVTYLKCGGAANRIMPGLIACSSAHVFANQGIMLIANVV